MIKKISSAFDGKKAFIAFITPGDPDIESTKKYIRAIARAGADLIEIGIPFSDPIAEGPVIQEADIRALASGTTTDDVFDMVAEISMDVDVPLVFMTYLNPVFHYGYDRFFKRCHEVGILGIIIPDLPFEEKAECAEIATKYGVTVISMVAPTSSDRIKKIASKADGFIYVVSSMGVTGERDNIKSDYKSIISTIREVTDVPAAVGFGINTPQQAHEISMSSDGVIVGSAIIRIIARLGNRAEDEIYRYVKSMKDAIS